MRRKKTKKRRIRKRLKSLFYSSTLVKGMRRNKNMKRAVIAIIIAAVAASAFLIYKSQETWDRFDVSDYSYDKTERAGSGYEYNEDIVSILLIGTDSKGTMEVSQTYGDQARADSISLVIFNTKEKTVKLLPVSRDTITDVTKYSASGYEVGSMKTHLGFAFSFGNGGHESSMNVCNAVSDMLCGAEVYRYITTNLDSIAYANDLIGGVTVTVPNNDLAGKYPEMTQGSEVTLTDENAADFLRYRDTAVDASNAGRMERQEAFLEAYVRKLETMSEDEYKDMWDRLKSDESKIKTNIKEKTLMSLIADLREYRYNPVTDNLSIEGENRVEEGYDVFYPDEAKLREMARTIFFKKL